MQVGLQECLSGVAPVEEEALFNAFGFAFRLHCLSNPLI